MQNGGSVMSEVPGVGKFLGLAKQVWAVALPANRVQAKNRNNPRNRNDLSFIFVSFHSVEQFRKGDVGLRAANPLQLK